MDVHSGKIQSRLSLTTIIIIVFFLLELIACQKLELFRIIKITTGTITDTTRTTCNAQGNIIETGEEGISEHGHCWAKTANPTITSTYTRLGSSTSPGNFISNLTGLTAGTKYYVKAYAVDTEGKPYYGKEISFTTLPPVIPTLTTSAIGYTDSDSATCGGNITGDGDAAVTARGVCWNTIQNPVVTDSHTLNGSGTGEFTSNMTRLSANTSYYVRAYATNSAGTAYGNERAFKTTPGLPTLTTISVTSFTDSSASCGGNIINDGGAAVTERGICWSTIPTPTLDNYSEISGSGPGNYIIIMTDLMPVTTYYVRAFATNSYGTSYGNEINFKTNPKVPILVTTEILAITSTSAVSGGNISSDGGAPVTARGVCWSLNPNPTVSDHHAEEGNGTGIFATSLTGLNSNTRYYVRAYATNNAGTGYGNELDFITKPGLPTLVTTEADAVTETTAVSGGTITNDGGATVTARGVCWSESPNPTLSDNYTSNGTGTGTFESNLTGLKNKTTFYVRAYATNSSGTQYGNQVSFTTASFPAVVTFPVSHVTNHSAISGGNVTSEGGSPVTAKGVCWSTSPEPTISDEFTTDGTGTGAFNSTLTDMESNTTYYLRAYATNSSGTGYGSQQSFITNISVTDIDGNTYNTVQIGTQLWMTENLRVTHFRDGSSISLISDNGSWTGLSSSAYCNYNNDENNVGVYGRLYNQFAAMDNRGICPTGWHVPNYPEWSLLIQYLGGLMVAGGKMKEAGTTHWADPNNGATNESGFTALPGGSRSESDGTFSGLGNIGRFWTASATSDIIMQNDNPYAINSSEYQALGASIRCIVGEGQQVIPTLTTTAASAFTAYTAISGGEITSDGYATIEARGVCWSASTNPTLADNFTTDGTGEGIFTSNITGLSPLTIYYVRAYATNIIGTAYGNQISFTTLSDAPADIPQNITADPGDELVNISWDEVSNATGYIIYWSDSPGVSKTNFTGKITDIAATSYSHTGRIKGTSYYYVVTARNDYGESDESFEVKSTPPLLFLTGTMSNLGEKDYHQVTVAEGQKLFINISLTDNGDDFYIYVKHGSLPTVDDYDFISNTGQDEAISITNTQAGTYHIMVYVATFDNFPYLQHNYTLTVSPCVRPLTLSGPASAGHIHHFGEKHYYEVTVSGGQNLFVNNTLTDTGDSFYLYAKFGSLPAVTDFDAKSETGEDEALSILNTQAGTYYIMVYVAAYDTFPYLPHNYTITAFTAK